MGASSKGLLRLDLFPRYRLDPKISEVVSVFIIGRQRDAGICLALVFYVEVSRERLPVVGLDRPNILWVTEVTPSPSECEARNEYDDDDERDEYVGQPTFIIYVNISSKTIIPEGERFDNHQFPQMRRSSRRR